MKIFQVLGFSLTIILIYMIIKNNVTPKDLGVKYGKLKEMPKKPNAVSTQTQDIEKKVEPLKFTKNIIETKNKILKIINETQGTEIVRNEKNYIHAIFKTGTMKYKDDVEFYFDEKNNLVHFRSASRVGYSDMGMNKKRYNEIKDKYYVNIK